MKFIDSHAHIYLDNFDEDLPKIIEESLATGVEKIYMPNIDRTSIEAMLQVEEAYGPICRSMMGLHPVSVDGAYESALSEVDKWLNRRPFAAVGEIGIDLYWDKQFYHEQVRAFEVQVDWAKELNLPVVIHCRESIEETIELVERLHQGRLRGVFHCFTGTREEAERIIAMGFYLGIGGVVTFKNGGLDAVIPELDLSNLLLETDSPYLAPVPFRGKRNDPTKIPLIAARIAELKACSVEQVAATTSENAFTLFGS